MLGFGRISPWLASLALDLAGLRPCHSGLVLVGLFLILLALVVFVGFVFQVLVLDFVLQVADVFFGLMLVTFAVLFLRLRLLRLQELLRKLFSYCENTTDADSGSDSIA